MIYEYSYRVDVILGHAQVVWFPRNLTNESTLYDLRVKLVLVDVYGGEII